MAVYQNNRGAFTTTRECNLLNTVSRRPESERTYFEIPLCPNIMTVMECRLGLSEAYIGTFKELSDPPDSTPLDGNDALII